MKKSKSENVQKLAERRQSAFSPFRFFTFSLFLLFSILFFASFSIAKASTPAEYRQKIQIAARLSNDLFYIDDDDLSPAERSEYERDTLAKLRKSLPVTEKVEWQGTSIETNNKWLLDKIDSYEKEKNVAKRETILNAINEQLLTIEQKLDELEKPSASKRTKDEDKRKLGEILRREEYRKPEKQDKSFMRRLMEAIAKWFQRSSPNPQISPAPAGLESISFVLQIALYVVILGAIGFLIYRFVPFFANRFNKREKREKKERVILGERIAADESADNLFSEAERLAREGNLRGAIRKGYIALLCELSDRKIIGLSHHKTNRDYLRDVRKRRELYESMNGLTSNFERHWYGSDEAEEKDWEEFRSGYRKAIDSRFQI